MPQELPPLFAEAPAFAEALYQRLGATVPTGSDVYLDVPASNPEAIRLAERHGLNPVFETARMYTGDEPDVSVARTYGITTFELG